LTTAGQFNVEEPVTVTWKLAETVAGVPAESLTSKVNWNVPVTVGLPETVAVGLPEVKESPEGSVEEFPRLQVYGGVPPLAVTIAL
jgi:hypothetical protein